MYICVLKGMCIDIGGLNKEKRLNIFWGEWFYFWLYMFNILFDLIGF